MSSDSEIAQTFRAWEERKKKYRATLPECPVCAARNPGGATKMHLVDNLSMWRCHYCGHEEPRMSGVLNDN